MTKLEERRLEQERYDELRKVVVAEVIRKLSFTEGNHTDEKIFAVRVADMTNRIVDSVMEE